MTTPHDIEIRVARDMTEIQCSLMLRAVVFMGGQRCPYQEEIEIGRASCRERV